MAVKGKATGETQVVPACEEYRREYVLQCNPGIPNPDPGPSSGAVHEALHHGYRLAGEPRLEGPAVHADGQSLVYVWVLPVVKVKGA